MLWLHSITKSSFANFRCPFGYAGFNCNDRKSSLHNHLNQAAFLCYVQLVGLRNIYASVCNANSHYSISFGCDRGVHCVGCIADHLYCGPDSCKLQVRVHNTFPNPFTQTFYGFKTFILSVCLFTIEGIKREAPHPRKILAQTMAIRNYINLPEFPGFLGPTLMLTGSLTIWR